MKSDTVFDERYKNLNKEQKMAVDTIEGPVLVVAGPGTGKTTILTLRIAEILRKTQISPGNILAITYTNAGVKAMREKLKEVIGNTAHDVYIHTFHSFASSMIAEYPDHFIRLSNSRQITDIEQESLIRNIIESGNFAELRPLGRPDAYISSIVRSISDAKKDAMTPDLLREYAESEIEKIKKNEDNISTRGASKGKLKAVALEEIEKLEKTITLSKVYSEYEIAKTKQKLRDYDDIIIELLVGLRKDELLLRLIQERFQYILVDEHQDTNDAQNFIVGLIAEFFKTPNVFVVGDEKQAIYRFQGASVENFLRLRKLWPDMKVISLSKNYRSHQSILDASFAMIENNYKGEEYKGLRVELQSEQKDKRPIDVVLAENNTAMEDYLVKELKDIIKNNSGTVAIITRRNRELERVLRLMESNNIAVSSERSVDIFHHPIGSIFFDFLEYVDDNSRIDLLGRTITFGMWGFSFNKSIEISRLLKGGKLDEALTFLPGLKNIREILIKESPVEAIVHIAEESGFTNLVSQNPSFVHVWRGLVTLSESLTRDMELENPLELIKSMLEYRKSADSKPIKVSVGAPDLPIKAMTAHGSKGLEFDYVFIPYANDETWVGRNFGSSFSLPLKSLRSNETEDIRRLFYVAITRARKHVLVMYAKEESDGKLLTPLRFISELHNKSIKNIAVDRMHYSPKITESKNKKNSEYNELLTTEAKRVLIENGLSVTALNHFLECPSKFLYESILKLPQAPSVSATKGSAMHEAISTVWNLKDRSEKTILKTINEVAEEFVQKSFLSIKEKEFLKKDILESSLIIAKALTSHFESKAKISTEKWIEGPFDGANKISIRIHGKLDVILELGDSVAVFDYKTKKAMSVSAIKGETKNDDGGYFRQLVFYKLLILKDYYFKSKKVETSLVFLTPDDYGKCAIVTLPVDDTDIKKVESEIQSLVDSVWSGKIATEYCSLPNCQYCQYRKTI